MCIFFLHIDYVPCLQSSHTLYGNRTVGKIQLSIEELERLSGIMQQEYTEWFRRAPASYKRPIWTGALPLVISVRYGQDRTFYSTNPNTNQARKSFWHHDVNFPKLARMALALPVHYRYYTLLLVVCYAMLIDLQKPVCNRLGRDAASTHHADKSR